MKVDVYLLDVVSAALPQYLERLAVSRACHRVDCRQRGFRDQQYKKRDKGPMVRHVAGPASSRSSTDARVIQRLTTPVEVRHVTAQRITTGTRYVTIRSPRTLYGQRATCDDRGSLDRKSVTLTQFRYSLDQ